MWEPMPRDEGPRSPISRTDPTGGDQVVRREAKALAVPARYDIFRRITASTVPVTVAELTAATGLHHNAVRQHLATLVGAYLVIEETEPPGRRGRPRLHYRAAPGVDRRWSSVGPYERLATLLVEMLGSGDSAYEVGRRAGRAERSTTDPDASPLDALVAHMAGLGFAPVVKCGDDEIAVVLEACPYETAALADPTTICELHRGLVDGLTEGTGGFVVDALVRRDPRRAGCELRCRAADH
jgi:predicted ArsR family transcriptional regulator